MVHIFSHILSVIFVKCNSYSESIRKKNICIFNSTSPTGKKILRSEG